MEIILILSHGHCGSKAYTGYGNPLYFLFTTSLAYFLNRRKLENQDEILLAEFRIDEEPWSYETASCLAAPL